jgi:sarcosine oxidase subunit beta
MSLPELQADVVIIGGGIMGSVAAFHLARAGKRVILLEQIFVGWASSGVNAGGVRRQGRHPAELPLAQESLKDWLELPSLIGTDCGFVPCDHLAVAESEPEMEQLVARIPYHAEAGVTLEPLDRTQLHQICPDFGPQVVGGTLCRGDGQANPRLVSPAFAERAREMGTIVREQEGVLALECAGGRVETVHTARGLYRGEQILNVAGAWGPHIAAMAGDHVDVGYRLPQMMVTEKIRAFLGPVLGFAGRQLSFKQAPEGNLVIGGGRPGLGSPQEMRKELRSNMMAGAARDVVEVFPVLRTVQVIRAWVGIEGEPEDKIPVIDRSHACDNLIHAFGFSGHGFQLGLGVGRLLARWILEGSPFLPIDVFNLRRVLKH